MAAIDTGNAGSGAIEKAGGVSFSFRHEEPTSGSLALVDDDLVGKQREHDQRDVEDDGGEIEQPPADVLEVGEEAQ